MLTSPNAGGNSLASEVLSLEVLRMLLNAKLSRTEMQLTYMPSGKITDYSCVIRGAQYGVSVTRALKFGGVFTRSDARALLEKKLFGIQQSTRNVCEERWSKQILHIFAFDVNVAALLAHEWHSSISAELKANTTVLITVTHCAQFVYFGAPRSLQLVRVNR